VPTPRRDQFPSAFALPLVLVLVALLLSIALVTAQSTLTWLCMLVLSTAAIAKAWSYVSLAKVHCDLTLAERAAFPGETLRVTARVQNAKLLPIGLQLRVPLADGLRSEGDRQFLQRESGLLSYQRVSLRWSVRALRRGVHTLGPVELTTGDPLGFYSKTRRTVQRELIVYPRVVPLNPVLLPRRDFFGRAARQNPVEDPTYVHGIRDYQPGRAARYIHWKASARTQRIVEKMFESSEQERVLLVLRAEHFAEDASGQAFERALEVAASLAIALDRQRVPVGMTTNCALTGSAVPVLHASRAPGHLMNLLELMARAQPVVAQELGSLLRQRSSGAGTTSVVCLCYRLDATHDSALGAFARRKGQVVSVLCGPSAYEARELARALSSHTRTYLLSEVHTQAAPAGLGEVPELREAHAP
jgi:uncharacterized protein (DUF58 family)